MEDGTIMLMLKGQLKLVESFLSTFEFHVTHLTKLILHSKRGCSCPCYGANLEPQTNHRPLPKFEWHPHPLWFCVCVFINEYMYIYIYLYAYTIV